MSDLDFSAPAPEPVADAGASTPDLPGTPAGAAADQAHPAWERTFEDAGIPDMLLPKLREQVSRTEAYYNQAIEKARAESAPAEWREFLSQAQGGGVTPEDLITSWNAAQAMRNDPQQFLEDFSGQIEQLVNAGVLTPRQAATAAAQVQEQVDDVANLTANPQLTQLQQQIQQLTAHQQAQFEAQQQAQQQQAEQQSLAEADAYAQQFVAGIQTQLASAGFGADADSVPVPMIQAVGGIADSLLSGDTTGQLTPGAAIAAAIRQVQSLGATPTVQSQPQIPVHGGGNRQAIARPQKFASEAEREAAMLAVGLQFQQ